MRARVWMYEEVGAENECIGAKERVCHGRSSSMHSRRSFV